MIPCMWFRDQGHDELSQRYLFAKAAIVLLDQQLTGSLTVNRDECSQQRR